MSCESEMQEYLDEIREQVCSRCIERPVGGPPCGPLGKTCGVEVNLPLYVEAVHGVRSGRIDPYLDSIHGHVCDKCVRHDQRGCPCPLDYLSVLIVEAIETVDERRQENSPALASTVAGSRKGLLPGGVRLSAPPVRVRPS